MPPGVSRNCHKTVILFICPWCKTIDLSCCSWFSKNVLQRKSRWLPAGAVGSFLWPPAPPTAGRCSYYLSSFIRMYSFSIQRTCPEKSRSVSFAIFSIWLTKSSSKLIVFFSMRYSPFWFDDI
nr:MAG TPA: hypothetical protein [Inoviridae sp.]